MQCNQYQWEVIRDLIPTVLGLKPGGSVQISISRHKSGNTDLLDWESSNGETYTLSELAHHLKNAYEEFWKNWKGR